MFQCVICEDWLHERVSPFVDSFRSPSPFIFSPPFLLSFPPPSSFHFSCHPSPLSLASFIFLALVLSSFHLSRRLLPSFFSLSLSSLLLPFSVPPSISSTLFQPLLILAHLILRIEICYKSLFKETNFSLPAFEPCSS